MKSLGGVFFALLCASQITFAKSHAANYGICYSQPQCKGEISNKFTTLEECQQMLVNHEIRIGSWSAKGVECSQPTVDFLFSGPNSVLGRAVKRRENEP